MDERKTPDSEQSILGTWDGSIDVDGVQLPLVLSVVDQSRGWVVSPAQGETRIPFTSYQWDGDTLAVTLGTVGAEFVGEIVRPDTVVGIWRQSGRECSVELKARSRTGDIALGSLDRTKSKGDVGLVTGFWIGDVEYARVKLPLVFRVASSEVGCDACIDSPNQGAFGKRVTELAVCDNRVGFASRILNARFDGTLDSDATTMTGTWRQGTTISVPLSLKKK